MVIWSNEQIGTTMDEIDRAVMEFDMAVDRFVQKCQRAGAYMPAVPTRLRLYADELATEFPDDANQGNYSTEDSVHRQIEKVSK